MTDANNYDAIVIGSGIGGLTCAGLLGRLRWNKMPAAYETFHFPDFSFKFRAGRDALKEDLRSVFPDEEAAIDSYFKDVD